MAEPLLDGTTQTQDVFMLDPAASVDLDDQAFEAPATASEAAAEGASAPAPTEPADPDGFDAVKPDDLPDALAERWEQERAKHKRNYDRRLSRLLEREKAAETYRQKAEMVDRFYQDRAYAQETIQRMAQQLGYTLSPATQQGQAPQGQPQAPQQGAQVPAHVLQAAQQAFADQPDLAFLAPMVARAAHLVAQAEIQAETEPLKRDAVARQEQEQAARQQRRQEEFERMAMELEDEGVDWQAYDEEMHERLSFLKNALAGDGPWIHPRYGSVLRMLHQWTAGPKAAQAEAGKRLQQAMTQRTSRPSPSRSPGVNTDQLIQEAKSPQDKWKIAMESALSEVRSSLGR